MKHVIKNMFKQFSTIILVYAITTLSSLHSMNNKVILNNVITITNQNDHQNSLLQLHYDQAELCPCSRQYTIVGINTTLSTPTKINCFITNDGDPYSFSLLALFDPKSQQKKLLLTAYNKESFTIHNFNKENKTIRITKNAQEVGRFTYE